MSTGKRLKKARVAKELTQAQLSELIGCSIGTISRLESNPKASMGDIYLHKAAKALGCREKWLKTGEGSMLPPVLGQTAESEQKRVIPIVTLQEAADKNALSNSFKNLNSSRTYSDFSFAIEMPAIIGGNVFPERSLVIVDPLHKPKNGDYILLVKATGKEPRIRRLAMDGGAKLAISLVEGVSTDEITSTDTIVGTIREVITRF